MKRRWKLRRTEGQSLVEMAIMMPILLVMFAGLIEVGVALRNYLIVVNANREGTRFAARGRWFDSPEARQAIFARTVAAAGIEQRGADLVQFLRPVNIGDLGANTAIAVTYIEVPDQIDDLGGLAEEPHIVRGQWISGTLPLGAELVKADIIGQAAQRANYEFNQEYFINRGELDIPSEDNIVIVEIWFQHEQILKLPIFTEILPETFTLYAQSTMRVTLDSRVGGP
jgi:hypothetical protein